MGYFNNMLKDSESVFLNPVALDYDYQPKLVPYRESHQRQIAACIKPLFNRINGRNLLIHGKPGVGKTVATKNVLSELENESDEISTIFINCWQKNTFFKIAVFLCEELGYKLTHNKSSEELFKIATQILNKKSAVFIFDEVDKLENNDILYFVLEKIFRKSIVMITNEKTWIDNLDIRIKSRLLPEIVSFNPYSKEETDGILRERMQFGFSQNVWKDEAFSIISDKTFQVGDIRAGLYLMKEAGLCAEERSSRKVDIPDVEKALLKLHDYTANASEDLSDDTKNVLELIKANSGAKIGDLYKIYESKGSSRSYKSFQRDVKRLEDAKFVRLEKLTGDGGNTTIVKYSGAETKKLTDF